MNRFKILTIIFLLAIGVFALAGLQLCTAGQSGTKPASVLMQEALYAEEIDGDLDEAIKIYDQVIKNSSAQRSHIAQAMYRQGTCYMKQNKEQQAQEIFQKIVAQYSEQTEIISKIKPLLSDLGNADPASLMPPETLFYAEIGSPGRQVETILNMLKGTALENPLAVLGGSNGIPQDARQSANFIASLLNPGMMAEFKKIQGVGIGITGIPAENEPPALVVLFPGKSDALKGLLQMALTMAGKPAESIEGMQTVELPEGGRAAYDDTVVILSTQKAYSAGQFAWSIKQYKGQINEPTLASSNKSFTKVSKTARQKNLVTVWVDTDRLFAELKKVLPEGELPEQFRMMDNTVNLDSVDDVLAFFSLEKTGIAVETNIAFKDGHNSLAYNMLRTPNLDKAGFEAVPSGAIGLISVALGGAESFQAQALGQKIREATGLDIGGEIFSNIEQISLFIMPPDSATAQTNPDIPKIATSIGLAVKSRDPEQTRQILAKLLEAAHILPGDSTAGPTEPVNGRYEVPLVEGQKIYCYINNDSKTTVLSISPAVIEASIAAIKNRQSVLAAGPLQEQLSKISPNTCKLLLFNVGGIVRTAKANSDAPDEVYEILDRLASSTDATCLQLRTNEQNNNLNIRADVTGIPPINEIFIPIMQLTQIMESTGKQHWGEEKQKYKTVTVRKADRSPKIDGKEEKIWSAAPKNKLGNAIYSPISSDEDFSAYYKTMWDEKNLYVLVDVTDDKLENYTDQWFMDDCIEIFIDADNSKSEYYDENDYQFHFDWDKSNPKMDEDEHGKTDGVEFAMITTENGYRTEIKFPWTTLGTKPSAGTKIGFEVYVNDDDDGDRTKLAWYNKDDHTSGSPRNWGIADMAGLVGWWKLDESQGNSAADSSGNNHNGRLMGDLKWQPTGGKIAGALQLDGVNDYVETDFKEDLPNWTISVWAKSPAAPSSEMPSGPVHREKNFQINWNHVDDGFRGAAGVSVNGGWYDAGFGDLQADTWYHLVATYDGENLKAYKNGALITNNSAPSGNADAETETAKLGRHAREENFFAGTIDDVRIYNYALSEDEIKAIGN